MSFVEPRERKRIISLDIDLLKYQDALAKIVAFGKSRRSGYICFANVHMTIEAYNNKNFADQVNNATLVLADGVPLVKTLNFFYGHVQERVAGMDVLPDVIALAEKNDLKIFFFGTTPDLLEKIKTKVEKEFPRVNIVGLLSPPFEKRLDSPEYIDLINNSGAHMVFVALGCPKQEKWMADHFEKINALLLGVGGAFPVYAGVTRRAPAFMRDWGLEWLYRLYQEPKRLFKRYLKTNSLFIYLVLKAKLTRL
jgi:N-acetylglucosaminyldiphosphoundecaprenol N-acetyl-beta-D-mannosaminyltransferase